MKSYGTPQVIESDQGMLFMGATVQKWAKVNNTDWQFHLTYCPVGAGLIEIYSGLF